MPPWIKNPSEGTDKAIPSGQFVMPWRVIECWIKRSASRFQSTNKCRSETFGLEARMKRTDAQTHKRFLYEKLLQSDLLFRAESTASGRILVSLAGSQESLRAIFGYENTKLKPTCQRIIVCCSFINQWHFYSYWQGPVRVTDILIHRKCGCNSEIVAAGILVATQQMRSDSFKPLSFKNHK